MGRCHSPILQRELANLDKDAESRRTAMKTLTSYAKDLDTKAIPHFLAQVSDTKGTNSSSGECTISLFEVLARVHGRNIVPQIDNIMSTITRTLSSSGGSFPLHQACSKVVPAIARYGIDPSTPDSEKAKIISLLCKPLSDALMSSQESLSSGASLCLKALVECGNRKFAPDDMVNEVCLKVAGALEEKVTQTNSHMGLVMALAKHNAFTMEAYARSLFKSGLQILDTGVSTNNLQKRFSAIQIVNFLMKCLDSRSIVSELVNVVEVMETCQSDQMAYVRGAAFEALQTAKLIISQKNSKLELSPKPNTNTNSPEFASPESQTVDSCLTYDAFTDSPLSIGQSAYSRRANRRLWSNEMGGVDLSFKDSIFLKDSSECNGESDDIDSVQTESFSGFVRARPNNTPQRCYKQLNIDDIQIYSTPRRLVRSLQNPDNAKTSARSASCEVESKPTVTDVQEKKPEHRNNAEEANVTDDAESVSSTGGLQKLLGESDVAAEDNTKRARYGKRYLGFFVGLVFVILAIVLSAMRVEKDEPFYDFVPT